MGLTADHGECLPISKVKKCLPEIGSTYTHITRACTFLHRFIKLPLFVIHSLIIKGLILKRLYMSRAWRETVVTY